MIMSKVVVYSTPTCPHCVTVKKYLKEKDIAYTDLNVAEDQKAREEMIEKTGRMAVPVIMVDDEVVVGFNKTKLDELLG
jgi:glutaredoxin 3